jgi:4-diphosphocytidyl-2-C-methyl-D-erythritol kinase
VPACFAGSPCFAGGVGDQLAPAPALPPAGIVLVNPRVALPTPEAFGRRSGAFSQSARFATAHANARDLAMALRERRNDLTPGAVTLVPVIAVILAALESSEGCHLARMSGSGASCFGIYDDAASARRAADFLRMGHPHWWIVATELLTR